jgi:ribosomal protein S6--L-glutamate ligase/gamma-F420-2:alpha-L-glutamate ligase
VIGSEARETKPSFVLFWDKDVMLARAMGLSGLKLFNGARAIQLADDKAETALKLAEAGVPTVDTIPAPTCFPGCRRNPATAEEAARILGWPLVIKENKGSFGAQVYLANNIREAERILTHIGEHDCIFQRFIAESKGRDLRVTVVGGKVICAMERQAATKDEFRSNIGAGGTATARTITDYEAKLAVDAANALGLDFAGVDILMGREENERYVCEVNSNPQLQSTIDCCGINPATNIMWHIRSKLKEANGEA